MIELRDVRQRSAGLVAGLLVLVAAACSGDSPTPDVADGDGFVRATRVVTRVVMPRSFDEIIQVTGAVDALNDATLSAQASGKVARIAEHGDEVAAGDVVAQLDQATAAAAVQQAEAALQTAETQLALALDTRQRLQPLRNRGAVSASEYEQARLQVEQAEAGVRQAEAALTNARVQLDNTVVRAPFDGTVEQAFLEEGEHAGSGDPLIRLISIDEVMVFAGVPERYASDLEVGMSVALSFPNVDLPERTGEVTFVGAAIDMLSRTFRVEVSAANPDGDLKPMMLAELRLARVQHQGVLTLPRSAIVLDELGPGVFVVEGGDQGPVARRKPVTLGANAIGFVIVESGLEPGDQVIILGQNNVADGDPVEVSSAAEATGLPGMGATG